MTKNCNNCIHCSLDGVICHLHHKYTDPRGTCRSHTEGGPEQEYLRHIVTSQCTKKKTF